MQFRKIEASLHPFIYPINCSSGVCLFSEISNSLLFRPSSDSPGSLRFSWQSNSLINRLISTVISLSVQAIFGPSVKSLLFSSATAIPQRQLGNVLVAPLIQRKQTALFP